MILAPTEIDMSCINQIMNLDHGVDAATAELSDQLESNSIKDSQNEEDEVEDDDFGSFDEATFEDRESKAPDLTQKVQKSMNLVFNDAERESLQTEADAEILNPRSRAILDRLLAQRKPNSFKWQKSFLRRQLYLYLGLPINLDDMVETFVPPYTKKDKNADLSHLDIRASTGASKEELKQKLQNTDDELEIIQRDVQSSHYYQQAKISEQSLNSTAETLKDYEKRLKDILGHYMALESELLKDQQLYESYVENMVDNTQKLRRKATLRTILSRKKK